MYGANHEGAPVMNRSFFAFMAWVLVVSAAAVARPSPPESGERSGERWNLSPGKCVPFQGQMWGVGMGGIP